MNSEQKAFFTAMRDFLVVYLPKQRCVSLNTIKSYRDTLNLFVDFMVGHKKIPLAKLSFIECTYANISDFLDFLQSDRGCGSSTRNQRLFVLKSFFKYTGTRFPEWISLSFEMEKIPVQKKANKLIDIISEDALRCILKQPDPNSKSGMRNLCFMVLIYDTAARDREMLDLTVGCLHLNQKHPAVMITGKGNKTRMVPIMEKTKYHLERYLSVFHPEESRQNDDFLFYTTIHGQRNQMSDDNVAKFMAKYGAMAKRECISVPEKVTPHMFRHARAIHLYRSGVPLPLLAEFMGHASIQSTNIYAYADTEMKRLAIEKATNNNPVAIAKQGSLVWRHDDELIKRLYGLK